jgi:SAM-dependent methyltransferase
MGGKSISVDVPSPPNDKTVSIPHSPATSIPNQFAFSGFTRRSKNCYRRGMKPSVQEQFGQIDIYVFDQILRGNIDPGMRVVDAGCGFGRNLVHLLREGTEIFAIDQDRASIEHVKKLSGSLGSALPAENFSVARIEQMPFADGFADVVICNSVLHFARDDDHFYAMVSELWRVVRPGGMLFCRLGSRIGMEFERVQGHRYVMGDGSKWFLVDEQMLMALTEKMKAVLVDPLKTTVVQECRCMTTWVLRKPVLG